ncbi:hypothetical protein OH805_36825 [Streptomyces sp. NBC_00879]|uniref:hypothetical protein n=1 Tax=Streptomyces sp. NBC_00879 TaxID=2975855 RepID=UPI00386740EB|nr:hypothetical protein OH805_36825 [Streptomyces sp. NBC_00879]
MRSRVLRECAPPDGTAHRRSLDPAGRRGGRPPRRRRRRSAHHAPRKPHGGVPLPVIDTRADRHRTVTGQSIDVDDPQQVPLGDSFAFNLIQASDTLGLFQLESPSQMDLLSSLHPSYTRSQKRCAAPHHPGRSRSRTARVGRPAVGPGSAPPTSKPSATPVS